MTTTELAALPVEASTPPKVRFPQTILASANPEEKPDCKRPALLRMEEKWKLPDLLLGGTKAMHEAGDEVLVQEQDETPEEFKRRLSRTVLTGYYGDTIARHSSLPFAKGITFDPPLPERLAYLEENADGCGKSASVFFRDVLYEGLHRGLSHVLVDVSPASGDTLADELKRRPKLVHLKAGDLFDAEEVPSNDGDSSVTYARFRQSRRERKGAFGETASKLVMVIETDGVAAGAVATYSMRDDGNWALENESPYTRANVPLFTFYAKQVDHYEGEPAYSALAELNLAHFQSDADQRHGLSYGRRATLVQTGWKESTNAAEAAATGGKVAGKQSLGFGRRLKSKEGDAKAYFLETSGAPLKAGAEDLTALEERMERFGAAQVSKAGGITAMSRKLDNQRDTCNLQAWCTRMESVVLHSLLAVAEWNKVVLPAEQKVLIDRSFADETPAGEDVPHIIALARDKLLSLTTTYAELVARGTLTTVVDPEAELDKLLEETEKAGALEMERMAAAMKNEGLAPPGGEKPPFGGDDEAPAEGDDEAKPPFGGDDDAS